VATTRRRNRLRFAGATSVAVGVRAGGATVTLAAGDLDAMFIPSVGMLGASMRFRGERFLALPGGVSGFRAGHTTGIPILAPWANRLAGLRYRVAGLTVDLRGLKLRTDDNGLPIHGTVGAIPWEVMRLEAGRSASSLRVRFDYSARKVLLAAFPFPHELTMEVAVAHSSLTVSTRLTATGRRSVPVSFGYHPYFRLPKGGRSSWALRLPARRRLLLDGRGIPTGRSEGLAAEEAPIGDRTFDDLFQLGRERRFSISHEGRMLEATFDGGYPFAQVYAPPGRNFICLEPMTAPTNALLSGGCALVAPGDTFAARFSVRVQRDD
jgi:aldose 1-epimerase